MVELISLEGVSDELKIMLLRELGFDSDGKCVLTKDGKQVYDKYINEPVLIENMAILPFGSITILDNNPLSISSFLEEYDVS